MKYLVFAVVLALAAWFAVWRDGQRLKTIHFLEKELIRQYEKSSNDLDEIERLKEENRQLHNQEGSE